ncbi:MAG: hypothetical protein JOZ52_03015 [Acidobacteria bacterium]|nr:hypothetical protein [Acidobacteriota bacterium]
MKKALVILVVLLAVAGMVVVFSSNSGTQKHEMEMKNAPMQQQAARVPAHFEDAKSAQPLKPTLAPEQFFGNARRAYQVAREIPETLAQLPCYCYCDQGFGHKSLHTCYESDHSAHCATCVDEALMAYQLEKEQKLSPAQIRQKIIERFSR